MKPSADRPNFLVFMTDQQRADHLGCYGNRILRTPNIDALAASGIAFDRFYAASPVCMPNRAALLTGRMPSACGARMNGVPLPLGARTHVDALRMNGWRTALIGKCHLQNMTDAPPAWRPAGADPGKVPAQPSGDVRDGPEYQQESMSRWRDPAHRVSLPYYGFEHAELCLEHGDEVGGDYARWLAARGVDQAVAGGVRNALAGPPVTAPQAWRTAIPAELYPSAYVRDRTLAWLEEHAMHRSDQPFYLQCSFPDPHHPFTPPAPWFDLYDPRTVDLPATARIVPDATVPHLRALHGEFAAGRRKTHTSRAIAVSLDEAREAIAINYGSIAMIDAMIGNVLAALDRLKLRENTVIVFLSDHGDFMGDHGLLFKGPLHYQSIIRTPFLWSDPLLAGGTRRPQLASAIDLAPSILSRAGLSAWHGIQGIDLNPVLRNAECATRDALLIEEEGHRPLPGLNGMPKVRTIVSERWRLSVHAHESWGELYDLENDPQEIRNLWSVSSQAAAQSDLLWRLSCLMGRYADDCPLPLRAA